MDGILHFGIPELPVAVVDVETTGLTPRADRIIEVSVVRIEPYKKPELAFDTLVNPLRRVAATEIHGITDDDVRDAPEFGEIAEPLLEALSGCVVFAYNAYFDMRFLVTEFEGAGQSVEPPYACLMYLRPMLGLGERCTLQTACACHSIRWDPAHRAATDALAAAQLWPAYLDRMQVLGVQTYLDLAELKDYKFVRSFACPPLRPQRDAERAKCRTKSRPKLRLISGGAPVGEVAEAKIAGARSARHEYWETLKAVLSDLTVTRSEQVLLDSKRQQLGLADEQVRSLHARIFAAAINSAIEDRWLDDEEASALSRLHSCLHQLGWSPGDPPAPRRPPVQSVSGKRVVLTGTLESFGRQELIDTLEALGATVTSSVSNRTDLVIVGENPGSKYDKAKELNVETWDEAKLLRALR